MLKKLLKNKNSSKTVNNFSNIINSIAAVRDFYQDNAVFSVFYSSNAFLILLVINFYSFFRLLGPVDPRAISLDANATLNRLGGSCSSFLFPASILRISTSTASLPRFTSKFSTLVMDILRYCEIMVLSNPHTE